MRLVVEREFVSFDDFSQRNAAAHSDDAWLAAWTACKPFVSRAWREVFDTVD